MKKIFYVLLMTFVLLATPFSFAERTEANSKHVVHSVNAESTVYETAKTDAKKVTTVYKGEFVTVLSSKNGWSTILFKGKKGYVKSSVLTTKIAASTQKQVAPKEGLKIYATPNAKSAVYSTLKQNAKVNDFGAVNKTWSFVQSGNVTGFVLTKSLTAKAASAASSKSIGFYQGLVPIGLKKQDYTYHLSSSQGYGGHNMDKFVYAGNKKSGKFSLTMTQAQNAYTTDVYSETTKDFTFTTSYHAPVKVDYPLKANNKKTYTAEQLVYDENGKSKKVKNTYTTTVKVANGTYAAFKDVKISNAVVIEITGPNKLKATYVFRLNQGLVYAKSESLAPEFGEDFIYTEIIELLAE